MRSAQTQQAFDPQDAGMAGDDRDPGSSYMRIAQDVFARIEERLGELKSRTEAARPPVPRASFGGSILRVLVILLLVIGVAGGALAFEWPRSEAVRLFVAQWAPQSVLDMLPATDTQDQSADAASSELRSTVANPGSSYQTTADNDEANANLSPMQQQQLIQKLVRDVETLQQGMDQLRAGQDQMLRMMLRTSAPVAQARALAAPRPVATTGLAPGTAPPPRRPPALPPSRFPQ